MSIKDIPIRELAVNADEQTLLDIFAFAWQSGYQAGVAQAQRQLNEFLHREQMKYTRPLN